MDIFEMAIARALAGGGNTGGGGGASGGSSIKKIEFTDRPSAWTWLVNNYNKVIRSELLTALSPVPTIFNDVTATFGTDELRGVLFSTIVPRHVNSSIVAFDILRIEIGENDSEGILGSARLETTTTPAIDISGQTDNTIPDEAWAAYGVKVTLYYIAEVGGESGGGGEAVSYTNCKVSFFDDEGNASFTPVTVSYKTYENGELKNVSKQLEGSSVTEILAVQGTEMFIDQQFNYWVDDPRLSGLSIRNADNGAYIIVPYLEDCYITISSF